MILSYKTYMIRVLQVLPRLRRGGSQAMVMNLYRAIDRSKIQFDFIIFTEDKDDYYDEIYELGGRVYNFKKFNGKNLLAVIKEWNIFFSNHPEYKILHSHVRSFASIYIPIAKKHGVATIIHSHSTSNGKGIKAIIKSCLEFPLRYQADYLFACSTEAGKWLFGKESIKKRNYRFIPNAIDIPHFLFSLEKRERTRASYGINKEIVIGHVGGFETPKNHPFLIDCFCEFLGIYSDAKLLLVGDGTYEEEVKKLCHEKGVSGNVIFAGLQADVAPYLAAMDFFLFPSLWEGLPVSVIEAQASGLTCLLSDTITKDVELTDLLVYYPLSAGAHEWATKIKQLLPDKRDGVSKQNLVGLSSFDSKNTIRELEQFYVGLSRT